MSRKVLYRAWDKKYKVMLEGFAIYDEGDQIGMSWTDSGAYYTEEQTENDMGGHFGSGDDWLFIMNDFELLQAIGVKDKKGNEAYEGDLVKVKGTKRIGEYITEIIWFESGFRLKENKTYLVEGKIVPSMIEVVGNIYANPELLQP